MIIWPHVALGNYVNGSSAVRCVYLTNGAALVGFTLTNGATRTSGNQTNDQSGGGLWCASTSAVISNCVLVGNSAYYAGGGIYSGTLYNCVLTTNTAQSGGGASGATLNNCVLTGNTSGTGGGAAACTLNNCTLTSNKATTSGGAASQTTMRNCIAYFNSAPNGSNYSGGTLNYCCTRPLPVGTGNFTNQPLFVDYLGGNLRLQTNSPCINTGENSYVTNDTDLDGNPRIVGVYVDMGAYEYQLPAPIPLILSLQASYTNVATGFSVTFTGQIFGHATGSWWDFGDGTIISNQLANVSHSWAMTGDYLVALRAYNESYPAGIVATVTVHVADALHYVRLDSTNPLVPYVSWATAATNLQDAVSSAYAGATVLVSNGVFRFGGVVVYGTMTNRVAVPAWVTLQSVNGPQVTLIEGYQVPSGITAPCGDSAVRCAYLGSNAMLIGFTLTNGATRFAGDVTRERCGGGVFCENTSAAVSNCVLVGNAAAYGGGGGSSGTFYNCTLTNNYAGSLGGGSYSSTLNNCTLTLNSGFSDGGGCYFGTLNNCTLAGNTSQGGGGSSQATLNNCLVTGNSTMNSGSGSWSCTLNNCTLTGNSGGVCAVGCNIKNSILYYNNGGNWSDVNGENLVYCCTTPLPGGAGNFTNQPSFVDYAGGNLRLQASSPCVNSGYNAYGPGSTDLDGNARISGGTVDMGAYELQNPGSVVSYAWLQSYGLPTNGSADYADPDGDGMSNWQEWVAGTNPTNAASVLKMLSASPGATNVVVTWSSVSNRVYSLARATNALSVPAFSVVWSNIAGQAGTTSFTDPNPPAGRGAFYRAAVQPP